MTETHQCRGCGTEVEDGEGWLLGVCNECRQRHYEAQKRMDDAPVPTEPIP